MKATEQTFLDLLMQNLREVYREESQEIVKRHKEEMSKELDNLMDELVTRASLRIESLAMVERFGTEIRILIKKKNKAH